MSVIITEERFLSLARKYLTQAQCLKAKFPDDKKFKKIVRIAQHLPSLYKRDKVYAVRQLNYLEKAHVAFSEEQRATIVNLIELLQKLILHKKLNQSAP